MDRLSPLSRGLLPYVESSSLRSSSRRCLPENGTDEAAQITCAPWDESRFRKVLQHVRALTREPDPATWHPQLIELCASAGVAVVTVPEVSGARTNGAARWLTPTKGLIQLSIRGRWSDIFWFSFFHEACHILDQTKQPIFLSGKNKESAEEQKADRFAQDLLIPPSRVNQLNGLRSVGEVQAFAKSVGVHPGIVVGRLHHERIRPFSWGHTLRQRLAFAEKPSD